MWQFITFLSVILACHPGPFLFCRRARFSWPSMRQSGTQSLFCLSLLSCHLAFPHPPLPSCFVLLTWLLRASDRFSHGLFEWTFVSSTNQVGARRQAERLWVPITEHISASQAGSGSVGKKFGRDAVVLCQPTQPIYDTFRAAWMRFSLSTKFGAR